MTSLPPAPDTIMSLVKFNCTKSNPRIGKCICKKAKLYCPTLFACSLDNDVVYENQEIGDKRIMDTSDVDDYINVSAEFCHCIETSF